VRKKEERKRRKKIETAAAKYGIAEFAGLKNDSTGIWRTADNTASFMYPR